jgi:hypothetical protein
VPFTRNGHSQFGVIEVGSQPSGQPKFLVAPAPGGGNLDRSGLS